MAKNFYRYTNEGTFIQAEKIGGGTDGGRNTQIGVYTSTEQITAKLVNAVSDCLKFNITDSEMCEIHERFNKIIKKAIKESKTNGEQ